MATQLYQQQLQQMWLLWEVVWSARELGSSGTGAAESLGPEELGKSGAGSRGYYRTWGLRGNWWGWDPGVLQSLGNWWGWEWGACSWPGGLAAWALGCDNAGDTRAVTGSELTRSRQQLPSCWSKGTRLAPCWGLAQLMEGGFSPALPAATSLLGAGACYSGCWLLWSLRTCWLLRSFPRRAPWHICLAKGLLRGLPTPTEGRCR